MGIADGDVVHCLKYFESLVELTARDLAGLGGLEGGVDKRLNGGLLRVD